MKRPPKMRTTDLTRLNLDQEKYYRPFIDGYIKILQSNLQQVEHIGHNYSYTTYTCEKPHDRRNPNWKPFRLLWDYCERTGYDFYVVRDIIFERLGRKLVCECELLRDDEKRRRSGLERHNRRRIGDCAKGSVDESVGFYREPSPPRNAHPCAPACNRGTGSR